VSGKEFSLNLVFSFVLAVSDKLKFKVKYNGVGKNVTLNFSLSETATSRKVSDMAKVTTTSITLNDI